MKRWMLLMSGLFLAFVLNACGPSGEDSEQPSEVPVASTILPDIPESAPVESTSADLGSVQAETAAQ